MKPGWSLDKRDKNVIQATFPILDWLYHHYFFVQSDGWHHIPQGKVLMVGSHNGGMAAPDLQMFMYDWYRCFGLDRAAYGLMHPSIWEYTPKVAEYQEKLGAVAAHPSVAASIFRQNYSALVYPGG
jgi:hypothetical protein